MKQQYVLEKWENRWHLQLNKEPITSKKGNILTFTNKAILERLLFESNPLESYYFEVLSNILDCNSMQFTDLWSASDHLAICKVDNSTLDLNLPSFVDYTNQKEILFTQGQHAKQRFESVCALAYQKQSIERKIIITEFVKLGFNACLSLVFVEEKSTLSEFLESQRYLQNLRFEQSEQYFMNHLDARFKALIELFALL